MIATSVKLNICHEFGDAPLLKRLFQIPNPAWRITICCGNKPGPAGKDPARTVIHDIKKRQTGRYGPIMARVRHLSRTEMGAIVHLTRSQDMYLEWIVQRLSIFHQIKSELSNWM